MPPIPWPDIAPRNEGSGLGMLANVVIGVMRLGGLPGLQRENVIHGSFSRDVISNFQTPWRPHSSSYINSDWLASITCVLCFPGQV